MEKFIEYITKQQRQIDSISPKTPISVINAGHYNISSFDYTTSRASGRPDYQIIYIVSGKMKVKIEDTEQIVTGGNVVIYKPNEPQFYTYLCEVPCEVYWVHFYGTMIDEAFKSLNLDNVKILNIGINYKICEYIDGIISQLITQNFEQYYVCCGSLFLILSEISEAHSHTNSKLNNAKQKKFKEVLILMNDMYTKFSLERFAKMTFMSVSRFSHLFKETFGTTPYSYYLNIRVNRAKILLLETNMSISEISISLGYEDVFYFSKLFKKNVGTSPQAYRKRYLVN